MLGLVHAKKIETRPPTYTITRINSKCIKTNISCNTINVLIENISNKISDIPCSNIFVHTSPRAREIKEK